MYTVGPKTSSIVPVPVYYKEPEHEVVFDMNPGQDYSASKDALAIVQGIDQDKTFTNQDAVSLFMFPPTGQKVRTVWHEGNVWFVARDVAECLGFRNSRKAIIDHCKGSNETRLPTAGGIQSVKIIPESDVYRLVMRSNLPGAEAFQTWVCEDVLPTLRRTGRYGAQSEPQQPQQQQSRKNDDQLILEAMQVLLQRTENLQAALNKATPKARFYDAFMNAEGLISITDAAKAFGMSAQALGRLLRSDKVHWLFKNKWGQNIPMHKIIDRGYMVVKYRNIDGMIIRHPQAYFTPQGMDKLAQNIIPWDVQ